MRLANYVFDFIAHQGVKHVFMLPGGGAMHLVDAVGQTSAITFVACHHEQAAGIAAEAYGRIHGTPGVVLVTTGPGGTNVITPVVGAWIESVPMVVISGQVKRSDRIGDSGVRQVGAQEVDIVSMVAGVTKYAVTVEDPQTIRMHLEKGFALATEGRGGPVWIDIPLDIQGSQINPEHLPGWQRSSQQTSSRDLAVRAAMTTVRMLKQSRRPLLLAGHGVRLSGASDLLTQFHERCQIPVATTWNAMDMIHYDHPLSVGRPGSVALRCANFAVQNCDLLIAIGARLDFVVTAYNRSNFSRGAHKIVVDIDPMELGKLEMPDCQTFELDARVYLESLLAMAHEIGTPDWGYWHRRCQHWKTRYPVLDGASFPNKGVISHYHLVDELSKGLPPHTLITTGSSGLGVEVFYSAFRNKPGQRLMLTSGLGSMGYGLPAAIGACLGAGGGPMVAIESDGSLQLNIQELSTLKQLQLPICLIIMNNHGYASIRNTQRTYFEGRYVGTGPEGNLYLPDLVTLAQAIGIDAIRIDDAEHLQEGLQRALNHHEPILVDIHLQPNESLWPKVAAIPQPNGSMLSMPLEDMSPLLSMEELQENMEIPLLEASIKARQT